MSKKTTVITDYFIVSDHKNMDKEVVYASKATRKKEFDGADRWTKGIIFYIMFKQAATKKNDKACKNKDIDSYKVVCTLPIGGNVIMEPVVKVKKLK